jgi:hypothetical protein
MFASMLTITVNTDVYINADTEVVDTNVAVFILLVQLLHLVSTLGYC